MAERYQNRPFVSDDYGRGGDQHGNAEGDPLAELARLIGQTDPFAAERRPSAKPPAAPAPAQSYQEDDYPQDDYQQDYAEPAAPPPSGPPSWMRRANVQPQQPAPASEPDYPVSVNPVHPLHRYSPQPTAPEPDFHQPQASLNHAYQGRAHQDQAYQDQAYQDQAYHQEQAYQDPHQQPDPARYDDALYGRLEGGEQDFQREPAYPDDPYAFQSDYPEADLDEPRKSRGGMMTVAAILALAVVGTGAAFAYKTYIGSPRSGEPPIIKADNTPTKVVPAPADSSAKVPDRMVTGDGSEKIVPREEAPVDVNTKA
ncbi:MAG TPA: SPOR domain-containing protein, partial [Bradyrhizobium sp.]